MLNRLFLFSLFLFPTLLFCQFETWIDGKRFRATQAHGTFERLPLRSYTLSWEYWQPMDTDDLQGGLGLHLLYIERDPFRDEPYTLQVGDRNFDGSLALGLSTNFGVNIFYVNDKRATYSGRFRLEIPVSIEAFISGGEKLVQRIPITRPGRGSDERLIWHKETIALLRPSLGLGLSYTHNFTHNISLGAHFEYMWIPGLGIYQQGGIMLEFRQKRRW